jgi:uncharacterized protein YgbK (DUF1537 family)
MPALTYFADDFTGATDALDALGRAGIDAALFLDPASPQDLAHLKSLRAIGVAGDTRGRDQAALRSQVRTALGALAKLGAPLCHYKVCSTFDSSPKVGSIGAAIEEGHQIFGGDWVPLVVGVPALGRWCVFGNLFARVGADGQIARLDRHPVSRHPVTPMREADLLAHLAQQTNLRAGLVLTHLADPRPATEKAAELAGTTIRLFDIADDHDVIDAARAITTACARGEVNFVVGSSGLEYALGALPQFAGRRRVPRRAQPVNPILVLSGSCSAISGTQIRRAIAAGFADIPLSMAEISTAAALRAAETQMLVSLSHGRSVAVHTALGPEDPRVDVTPRDGVAPTLARLAARAIEEGKLKRVIVIGGDTSSAVARGLGIRAVEVVASFIPGAPLCRAYAPGHPGDQIEIVFKGGSLGSKDILEAAVTV